MKLHAHLIPLGTSHRNRKVRIRHREDHGPQPFQGRPLMFVTDIGRVVMRMGDDQLAFTCTPTPITGTDQSPLRRIKHIDRFVHIAGLDGFAGIRASTIDGDADIGDAVKAAIASDKLGVDLLIVPVDRDADVAQRRAITAAVGEALAQ